MTYNEIATKYMLDSKKRALSWNSKPSDFDKQPYYLINGKKSTHMDLISLARQLGLPTNIRGQGVLEWSKKVASGAQKVKGPGTIEAAKKFVQMVKGPIKAGA